MALRLELLSIPHAASGCTFVASGAPGVAVTWTLTGPGTLTPLATKTNAAGVAAAYWSAGSAVAGDTITVEVQAHA